jgi:hypothetical protein
VALPINTELQNRSGRENAGAYRRLPAPAIAWFIRAIVGLAHDGPPGLWIIGLDGAVLFLQSWANRPIENALGPRFGQPNGPDWSWTAFLLWAWGLACFMLVRDVWFALRSIPT